MSNWEYVAFDELIQDDTKLGRKIKKEDYLAEGIYPIIDQGQKYIAGYTNSMNGLYTNVPAIIFGDHTRTIKYIDIPFFLGADGVKLLKSKRKDVEYRYLYNYFSANPVVNTGYSRHFKWLRELIIPLPPVNEQRKIAITLDAVSELTRLRKQQLEEFDQLVKSRFVEMFGRVNMYIDLIDLVKQGAGLSYGIVQPGNDGTGDMGVLRPVDMIHGVISTENIKCIDGSIGDGYKRTKLDGHEILLTVRGTTGITALTDCRFLNMNVTRGIAVIRYDEAKINPTYLNEYLRQEESQRYIQEHTRGATLQQINIADLRVHKILVPTRDKQDEFAMFIENIDELRFAIQQCIVELVTLKNSLMQLYFL